MTSKKHSISKRHLTPNARPTSKKNSTSKRSSISKRHSILNNNSTSKRSSISKRHSTSKKYSTPNNYSTSKKSTINKNRKSHSFHTCANNHSTSNLCGSNFDVICSKKQITLRPQVKNLDYVFNPNSVAIVGASKNPKKVGHTILRNFLQAGFSKKIYPINPNEKEIMGLKSYSKLSEIGENIDCAIIATPAKTVYGILKDGLKHGLKSVVVISGGFSEVSNSNEELRIKKLSDQNNIALIGPNCMGVLNPDWRNDSIFLPTYKLGRPNTGSIAFVSQSGAVGGCIIDLCAKSAMGMSKFISYGNGTCINETDLLDYLCNDDKTRAVISYIEGVRNGRKFMQSISSMTLTKPLVILKAGKGALGAKATLSHTGTLAGSYKIFSSAIKQAGAIEAQNLDELFHLAKILQVPKFFSSKIAVLTNGGGNGVLASDSIEKHQLKLAHFSDKTKSELKAFLPSYSNIQNPLDIIGDADSQRYEKSLELLIADENIDAIVVIILFQTASLDSRIINVLAQAKTKSKKPIVAVCTGGDYTQLHAKMLDDYQIPTYPSPDDAISALSKILNYNISSHSCD